MIGFPKGAGGKLAAYADGTGIQAIGLDETVDPLWADRVLPKGLPVQGNLDPTLLLAPWERLAAGARDVLERAHGKSGHIFNLGHGVLPSTDPDQITQLASFVREFGAA